MSGTPDTTKRPGTSSYAHGSSFHAAMRILPRASREAMFEIYSFCRAVDDIADEAGPREARRQALARWRCDIDALYSPSCTANPPREGLEGLKRAIQTFGLRREDFYAVIDGMEMDVETDIQAPEFAILDLYCDRVASAVGRLSVRTFGTPPEEGRLLAHHLGRALQLTNILRDLDEDAELGRLYLPREDLRAAGISENEPRKVLAHPAVDFACAQTVTRAQSHFAKAQEIMARCRRESVRAPRIMADVYLAILASLEKRGFAPPRAPARAPRHRVALAVLRYGVL